MALNNIQIQIVVKAMGAQNAQQVATNLQQVGAAAKTASSQAQNSVTGWGALGKQLGDIERDLDAVFRASSHMQAMGNTLRKFGETAIKALSGATKEWEEYEFTLNRAAGALEIFDVQAPMYDRLQTAINDVAKEVRIFPADEVAEAMYFWGSTTGQVVESEEDLQVLMKGITPILKAAAVTETDYGTAIKGVYSILQQYNMGLEDTGDVTAMLMLSTQKTALEFPDLINAFKMVGPVAAQTGASFEDVVQILGYLGDAGIRGTMSGRALRQMFIRMVKPTALMTSTMDELVQSTGMTNKSWHELTFPEGEFVGARKYIDLLAQATQDLTQDERQQVLAIMTTANELGAMTVLINDQIKARKEGLHILDEEKYALGNATEAFDKMFSLLAESWRGTLGYLQNSIGPVIRLIGANVASMATPFLNSMAAMAQGLEEFLKSNPKIVEWTIRITSAAAAVLILMGVVISTVGVLVGLGASMVFLVKGFQAFYTNILANVIGPIRILSILVPAVITALVNNFGGLRDAVGLVVDAFANLLSKLDFSGLNINDTLGRLAEAIMPALETAAKAVAWALERIADVLNWIADRKGAVDLLQGMIVGATTFIALRFAANIMGLGGAFSYLTGMLGNAAIAMMRLATHPGQIISAFTHMAGAVKKAVMTAVFSVVVMGESVQQLGMKGAVLKALGTAWTLFSRVVAVGARLIIGATGLGLLIAAVAGLYIAWENNFGGIQDIVGNVVEFVMDKIGWLVDAAGTVGNAIASAFGWIGETIDSVADSISVTSADIDNSFREMGLSAETGYQAMRESAQQAGMDYEVYRQTVADTMARHNMDVLAAMQRVEYDMLDTADKVAMGVSAEMSEGTRDWATILAQSRQPVGDGAREGLTEISDAVADEMVQAEEETMLGLSDIVSTLSESKTTMQDEAQALADAIYQPFEANSRRLQIEAELASTWIRDGLRSQDPRIRAQTAQFVEERLNQYQLIAPGAMAAGQLVNPQLASGINSNINLARDAAREVCSQTSTPIELCSNNAYGYGEAIARGFAAGIKDHTYYATEASNLLAAAAARDIRAFSPPKYGPLKHVDDFGKNVAKTWADGFAGAAIYAYRRASEVAGAARAGLYDVGSAGPINIGADGAYEKTISISIDVSSRDGTVNGASLSQLNDIFTGEEFISSLEHMATVS